MTAFSNEQVLSLCRKVAVVIKELAIDILINTMVHTSGDQHLQYLSV